MKVFVPIKENSQRVPRKNFRLLEGIPLYQRLFDKLSSFEVFVDTDSLEILNFLNNNYENVTAYKRKESLLGDEVSVCNLIRNFLLSNDVKNEWVCQVHVTSPFLKTKTLENILSLTRKEYDSIVSCNVHQSRFWRKEEYGYCPLNHNPLVLQQTQDLPSIYEENSLFYAFNSDSFMKTNMRVGSFPYFYKTDFIESMDIDTEEDWKLVKKIAESNKT